MNEMIEKRGVILDYLVSPTIVSGTRILDLVEERVSGLLVRDGTSDGDEFALFYFFFECYCFFNGGEGACVAGGAGAAGGSDHWFFGGVEGGN